MPDQVPAGWRDKVMHVSLAVGDQVLMGADSPPQYYEPSKGFSVTINVDDPAEARRLFDELAEDGTIKSLQKTFWAASFGVLIDRFGIPWMINFSPAA